MRLAAAGIAVFLILLFLLLPSPVEPIAWTPSVPRDLPAMPEGTLSNLIVHAVPSHGPEDIAVGADGFAYAGLENGTILKISPDGTSESYAQTGGRPLGLDFSSDGHLIVADSTAGILSISPDGNVQTLFTPETGRFANDVEVAKDGVIYYTTTTYGISLANYEHDIIESQPKGKVYRLDPVLGSVTEIMTDLHFANGLALSSDESFIAVVETTRYRVKRFYLSGEKKGMTDVLIDGLPAFPDGIESNGEGKFWIALPAPRNPIIDFFAESPFVRRELAKLPKALQPKAEKTFAALAIDENGTVLQHLKAAAEGRISMVSSVEEKNGVVYFASLTDPAFATLVLPNHLGIGGGAPANSP